MTPRPDNRHYVRRVVLPSGKTIEVVYFEELGAERPPLPDVAHEPPRDDLHHCASCDAGLVFPVEWEEAGERHWEVLLRCPNCEWWGSGVFEQATVERFDDELDRGTEALVRDLKRLMRANMEEEVERFVEALRDDHILPFDF